MTIILGGTASTLSSTGVTAATLAGATLGSFSTAMCEYLYSQ